MPAPQIPPAVADEHARLTRRYFLALAGLSVTGAAGAQLRVDLPPPPADSDYLTRDHDFGTVERGNPFPYTLPEAKLREIGMTRETWTLDVIADAATGSKVASPLAKDRRTALDWKGLMRLAEKRAVRYLKVMTCNNLNAPLGMGLWEGVPLRDVIWMAQPTGSIRRVYYYGHHNEDPKQMFRSSLSLSRVLEDPPGENPVLLAYKLNGEYLSGKRGGPVRMIVPEAYGFKSVKWLQRVVLTNLQGANDTYADEDNDVDSWMKTFARVLRYPPEVKFGEAIPVSGIAQVGVGGLRKVQYWMKPQGDPLPAGDPYFTSAPWKEAQLLGPPSRWGGGLPASASLADVRGFDASSGKPANWPMRYTVAHWAVALRDVPPGKYDLRCRTIDASGNAQPMPRPIGRSGMNHIEAVQITVKS